MADRGRPIPIGAAIYASAHKAVQPPDDRTYSAEVTVFQRNLPHHRSARAVSPYTRSDIIPPQSEIVKKNFRENHKVCALFSYNLRAAGRPSNALRTLAIIVTPLGLLGIVLLCSLLTIFFFRSLSCGCRETKKMLDNYPVSVTHCPAGLPPVQRTFTFGLFTFCPRNGIIHGKRKKEAEKCAII